MLAGLALLALLSVAPAGAQGGPGQAIVQPVQGLRFGDVLPGVPVRVDPSDVGRRGELQLEGRGRYQVQLVLPAAMTSADGAQLPLSFSAGDAALVRGTTGAMEPFDPGMGTFLALTGPAPDQPGGVYTANVTVLMARN
ncbi:MAG: hypothetical protein P8177_01690 [Gemmatimonadota bacterium]